MHQSSLPVLFVGGSVMVAVLATLTVPSGWFLWIPLGLVAFIFGQASFAK